MPAADVPGVELSAGQDASFDAMGQPTGGRQVLLRSRQGDELQVSVSPLGRTRVCSPKGSFSGYQRGLYVNRQFDSNFYGGGLVTPNEFVFFNMETMKDPAAMQKALGSASTGVGDWNALCSGKGRRASEKDCFLPSEVLDVSEESKAAYAMLNKLGLVDISNNLGDSKTLITHPSTTTHRTLTDQERADIGLDDSWVRLSVGLEDPADIAEDLEQALA